MVFIETPIFTQDCTALLSDHEYAAFQRELAANPTAGDVIPDTGGLRKFRVSAKGKGKRGGARVIYYYLHEADQIRLSLIYAKAKVEDLTPAQKKVLRTINRHWK